MPQLARVVARRWLANPWFPIVSIALLATAIGFQAAVFAAIHTVLLNPLPFANPSRIVDIHERKSGASSVDEQTTFGNYQDWQRSIATLPFTSLGARASADAALLVGEKPQSLETNYVTASLFRTLGLSPARGRLFTPEEEASSAPVAIITDGAWTRYFGRKETVIGSTYELDVTRYTVIGVAPPEFDVLTKTDVLLPFPLSRGGRGQRAVSLLGRLADNATPAQAAAALSRVVASLEKVSRENEGFTAASVTPLQEHHVGNVRAQILALQLLSLFTLLGVCANLVGLHVARLEWRARDMAIRAALGASRRRLVAETFAEQVAIALPAFGLGLVVAHAMLAIGKGMTTNNIVSQRLMLDWPAVAVAAMAVFVVAAISGLISVFMLLTGDVSQILTRATAAVGPGRLTQRTQAVIVIAQTALALLFLVIALTLASEVARIMRIDPGFNANHLWSLDIKARGGAHLDGAVQAKEFAQIVDALRAVPGVEAAGGINSFPLIGPPLSISLRVRDVPISGSDRVQFRLVTPDYFDTLGIPVRQGRLLAASDRKGTPLVALVNQAFADRYWGSGNPIGREVGIATSPWLRVVGVVANVRSVDINEPPSPELYLSSRQVSSGGEMTFVVRPHGDAEISAAAAQAAIRAVAPSLAVTRMAPTASLLADLRKPERFGAAFLATLALLAVGLAAVGTYSLVAFAVATRNREIAIRRVLGAGELRIRWIIVSRAAALIACGASVGIVSIVGLTRVYKSVLFAGHVIDPSSVAIAAAVLVTLGVMASYLPVRRAMRKPLRDVLAQ
jgi:predicted permease